jgi:hypothetical protein
VDPAARAGDHPVRVTRAATPAARPTPPQSLP